MALPSSRQQREYDKFVERADGQTAVATDTESYQSSSTLINLTNIIKHWIKPEVKVS